MTYRQCLILLGLVLGACGAAGTPPPIVAPPALVSPLAPTPGVPTPSVPTPGVCLPPDVQLSSIVSAQALGGGKVVKVTVQQTLNQIGAQCRSGTLVDSTGREIRFYPLTGCWGNPPDNSQDILQRQQAAIAKLKEQYTVIEMTCNPSGLPLQ